MSSFVLHDTTKGKQTEEALQKYTQRLQTLHEIGDAILAARSPEEIAQAVIDHDSGLVPWQRAGIFIFDYDRRESTVYSARYKGASRLESKSPISFDDLWKVNDKLDELRQGQVIVVDDMRTLPSYRGIQLTLEEGILSEVIAPLLAPGELIGTLDIGADRPGAFGPEDVEIIRELANSLAIAFSQRRLFEQVSARGERLRLLTQQLVAAQEVERRRLAQDLHDRIGQDLTALGINLSIIKSQLPPNLPPEMNSRLDDSLTLLEKTMESIRACSVELSPLILEEYGLDATLRSYALHFAQRAGIAVDVQPHSVIGSLETDAELALYRIVQEALTNVAKHAQASHVIITQEVTDQKYQLVIADNGVGFNPNDPYPPGGERGLGLLSMRDRAESIGGRLKIDSSPGHGTRVIVELER